MSYYLYTGGVLKLVHREEPKTSYKYFDKDTEPEQYYKALHECSDFSSYVTQCPSIQVSDELKKVWKEGDRPVEGKDFQLKLLTYYQFHGSATTGCFVGCSPERIDAGGCLCYSKHEYAVPPTLPVNTLQEEKEDQEKIWEDVYMELVRQWMDTTYKGKSAKDFFATIKSKYHITRKK